jgi:hypothetical protein
VMDGWSAFAFATALDFGFVMRFVILKKYKRPERTSQQKRTFPLEHIVLAPADRNFPVRFHVPVIWLADLKAKPVANHANTHPMQAWSYRICTQHRAPSPARGSGFKSDTTRTNRARMSVFDSTITRPRIALDGRR